MHAGTVAPLPRPALWGREASSATASRGGARPKRPAAPASRRRRDVERADDVRERPAARGARRERGGRRRRGAVRAERRARQTRRRSRGAWPRRETRSGRRPSGRAQPPSPPSPWSSRRQFAPSRGTVRRTMLRTLVDTLRSRARSVAPRPRTKSPSRAVRDADEPPILTTIVSASACSRLRSVVYSLV